MKKIGLKKEMKSLYRPSAKAVTLVEVPAMNYLMIDGEGDPNTSRSYAEAIETLFAVAYTVKFSVKKAQEIDYGVMPLESLWWADDMTAFATGDKSKWKWTAMIMQPPFVTAQITAEALAGVRKKKNTAALAKLRFESLTEGTCAQTLHSGPFSEEGPTIEKVHEFIRARGRLVGKHHEIYLSDTRKADPAKGKTVVRQPLAV